METSQKENKITVPHVFAWIFGVLLMLGGLASIASNTLGGIIILISSLLLLPPTYKIIKTKTKLNLTRSLRVLIVVALLGLGTIFTNPEGYKESYAPPVEVSVIFDLNSLYGKNIDEIVGILGKPENDSEPTELQIQIGTKEWDKTFQKGGYELLVTYYVDTRKVKDFFVPTNDSSGATKDTQTLKYVSGVNNSNNYIVSPVKAIKDPTIYTGIIITPKNKN